jgi:hypothetical protein
MNKREILKQYATGREFRARQIVSSAPFDGVMFNKSGIAEEVVIVEVYLNKQPTLKVDKGRIDLLVSYAKKHSTRAVLAVDCPDGIFWLNLTEVEAETERTEPLFPEATIKGHRPGEEDRVIYQIDTVLFRSIAEPAYQVES